MKCDIVVAHYNESLEWIDKLPKNKIRKVFVYSKGEECSRTTENLPNIGREAHTYLHHIITSYENLPEAVIFLQGDPLAHMPLDALLSFFDNLSVRDHTSNLADYPFETGLKDGRLHHWNGKDLRPAGQPILPWMRDNLGTSSTRGFLYWSAQFGVSRTRILSRKKIFYEKLLRQFETADDELAHFMERSWGVIFGL
jgi:hypothetical protein